MNISKHTVCPTKNSTAGKLDYSNPYDALVSRLEGARFHRLHANGPRSCILKCPAASHNDRNASLSIREFSDGGVGVKCFAGCSTDSILSALGLTPSDLFPHDYQDDYQKGKLYRSLAPFNLREFVIKNRHLLLATQMGIAKVAKGDSLIEEEENTLIRTSLFIYKMLEEVK